MLFAAALGMLVEGRKWFGKVSGIIITVSFSILLVNLDIIISLRA
ncbi:hypothetical protein [Catalinimonas niigatensis]|nr:hypothetical protein [Catalinimonas niigatensis]WPP52883.1 hypothetical protein PZB72_10900 [Catalinimonas niigatensis]